MIESLQKLLPWLGGMSAVPKLLFSLALVLLTAFLLMIIWNAPPAPAINAPVNLWPQEKSFNGLLQRIERTSPMNRRMLALILAAGRSGIETGDLARQAGITRDEVVYRSRELAAADLIEIMEMPDRNYRISEGVRQLLGPAEKPVLEALLQSGEKPHANPPSSGSPAAWPSAEIVGPSRIVVGKRTIYRAEFDGDLEFEWHYTQPVKLTDRNVFIELGYPGQTETLTLRVRSRDGRTYSTSKMITAVAAP